MLLTPAGRSILGITVPMILSIQPETILKTESTVLPNIDQLRPLTNVLFFLREDKAQVIMQQIYLGSQARSKKST